MKTIRELLTGRELLSIEGSQSVFAAAELMHRSHVGALLVISPQGKLEGIFTERDLMVRVVVARLDPNQVAVGDVMTSDLLTAHPDRRLNEVAREMQARHIRHLPVVEGEAVVGVLSLRDLLREHLDLKRYEVQALTAYIQSDGTAPQL